MRLVVHGPGYAHRPGLRQALYLAGKKVSPTEGAASALPSRRAAPKPRPQPQNSFHQRMNHASLSNGESGKHRPSGGQPRESAPGASRRRRGQFRDEDEDREQSKEAQLRQLRKQRPGAGERAASEAPL